MGLFERRTPASLKYLPDGMIPPRQNGSTRLPYITNDSALRQSAVWASLRIRADLISTMPIDVFRVVNGQPINVPSPPVLVTPEGETSDITEWMWATQFDLDRAGNTFGIIRERNALGLPSRIDLCKLEDVLVRTRGYQVTEIKIAGESYPLRDIWHERANTVAGVPLGLSPVAYAAFSIQENLSALQFSLDWFGGSAVPMAELKNNAKKINKAEAQIAKDMYRASVQGGDLFVHGMDWEYKPIQAVAAQSEFLNTRKLGLTDITRFFGVPADLIDAAPVGKTDITYANITQRNLQLFIINIGPAVMRRERALSRLTPKPRYVKLNRSAFLAMDPMSRAATIAQRLNSRVLTPTEARAMDDLPPLTDTDLGEFEKVYGAPRSTPTTATASGVPQ